MGYELKSLREEIDEYVKGLEVGDEGGHLWDAYQSVTGILMRLQQIRNDLAYDEITGNLPSDLKKFRTMILDPTIERFDKLAQFESRKITAKGLEIQLEK